MTEVNRMPCAACGHHDPAGRKFCTVCGAARVMAPPTPAPTQRLPGGSAPRCVACGAVLIPGKGFCGGCGTATPPDVAATVASAPPSTAVESACATCGAALVPSKKFCGGCGSPTRATGVSALPAVPAGAAAHPPAPMVTSRSSRRAGGILVASALVLILLGGGLAAFVVISSGDDPVTTSGRGIDDERIDRAGDDPEPRDGEGGSAPDETVTVTSPPDGVEPTTVTSPDPVEARCWDGTVALAVSQCTAPAGVAGLEWIAPGFDFAGENCIMAPVRRSSTRRFHYNCPSDGTDRVYFNFSEFDSNEWGRIYPENTAGFEPYLDRGFLRWDYLSGRGDFKTALLYETARWGVTIYSDDARLRDETAGNLLRRLRPASDLRGLTG